MIQNSLGFRCVPFAVLLTSRSSAVCGQAVQTITFSELGLAPIYFEDVFPDGSLGPRLSLSGVTMQGRVVLDAGNFAGAVTTRTHIYLTSDIYPPSIRSEVEHYCRAP